MLALVFLFVGLVASEFNNEIDLKFDSLPIHEFIDYFNSLDEPSWSARIYEDDVTMEIGAQLSEYYYNLDVLMGHAPMTLPDNFDSRTQWPHCESIKVINNQGACGSCYLFGSIDSASDRTCIHTGVHVQLSEQEGNCISDGDACEGGFHDRVLRYWVENGLVTKDCKPNDIPSLHEPCQEQCTNASIVYDIDKHYGRKAYQVSPDVETIKAEIVKNGPVVTGFKVYHDFKHYHGGVYEHTYGDYIGNHAVRVIGYGVEDGKEYWLVANSWGEKWGENGLVKIKQQQPELDFEEHVCAGLPRYE